MYLWIDLETTGLDPDNGEILEVAWFITDNWEIISQPQSYVVTPGKDTFELVKQDMFAQTVHYENGLLRDLMTADTLMLEDIEDLILKDIHKNNWDDIRPVLAGASVHFDRGFIREYMWRLDRELSYRHFDVSTLMMFFTDLGFPHLSERTTDKRHRAEDDIAETYSLARKYVNLINIMAELKEAEDAER
jgi:oligoribonuclease